MNIFNCILQRTCKGNSIYFVSYIFCRLLETLKVTGRLIRLS